MTRHPSSADASMGGKSGSPGAPAGPPRGLLASMRIRKKLIFLHSLFSLMLASILLVAVRPAVQRAVREAEGEIAAEAAFVLARTDAGIPDSFADLLIIRRVPLSEFAGATAGPGVDEPAPVAGEQGRTWRAITDGNEVVVVGARLESARRATQAVYLLLIVSLVAVYALIAAALEILVLPRHVYAPIRSLLDADRAVQAGDHARELVPESSIPADEIGEIMRSRNEAIRGVRSQETALANALDQLETVAADLKRKNHLLENTRRNLEGADRLMSLGMMSAGIAHELNTPLAVVKGLVDKLRASSPRSLSESEADLLGRVVGRLERLSEGLLDFARAREPEYADASLAEILDEAITLVQLDRGSSDVQIRHDVPESLRLECDAGRMIQVFVNLVRNAVDSIRTGRARERDDRPARIDLSAAVQHREGGAWITIFVRDTGPGIDPDLLATMFDPFVSTRLDSKGTGLGLAVAEGIVREHAGTIIARNRRDQRGAVFEIVLPAEWAVAGPAGSEQGERPRRNGPRRAGQGEDGVDNDGSAKGGEAGPGQESPRREEGHQR